MSNRASKTVRATPSWHTARLGEVLPLTYGKAKGDAHGYPRPGTPVYGSSGQFGTHAKALTQGPTLVVGRKGGAGSVHYSPGPCWPTDTAYYTEGNENVHLPLFRYLLEWLRLDRLDRSTAVPSLSRDDYNSIIVQYPTNLSEQLSIVQTIEEQLSKIDAGVAALRRAQANLKRYRASVLKAACEGRLVPTEAELARQQRRGYETGFELLLRAKRPPRPNRWNTRSTDTVLGHAALAIGNPETRLPEGWIWAHLVDLAEMGTGHTPSRQHPEWWIGNIPWITLTDARWRHGRTIHQTEEQTNEEGLAHSAARLLPASTVCISRTASVGYVVEMGAPMATSQDFVNWTPTESILPAWIRIVFSADRQALLRFGKGSVHKTIYFPEWLSIHIALPPLAEQERIAGELDRLLSITDQIEGTIVANLQRAGQLRRSALERAFRSES